ncbi:helicase [Tianweitania sp. BSSL-BM11]|uniref:Helicase n=1 Tax=Tianweitania aestuarii TaxID=2814886 RepID=A0ABS5RZ73_9HYPH|nr:helicase-related protein [Tianweitania aestuarii]MBS9722321.1 helicase [Tianweitania aestuarii]
MTASSYRSPAPLVLSGRNVTAVLGPTNTGKTHLAIERMVAHSSGVIGLPLRLLAREVYARVCEKVGADKVSLITGEEKIKPPNARYSVCTVEAMPRETDAAFVAIDEVQLAGDLERGHIFTDRILHLRGREETLLLGAGTMRGILERLLRGISVVSRPRMSHLAYAGSKKITRLPRRSAIVAFSADDVYAIAELIRRQRGGAAVVLGALSPRTRNAQVELYQSGDVDYLIATDAIGMGLNLDVDHVAFAQDQKFDGFQYRNLTPGEIGQIAGRAGRHLRDGTFGVTGQCDNFTDEMVERVEAHAFDPVKVLQWRNAELDFSSLEGLQQSIDCIAPVEGLTRALPAVDAQALALLARDNGIRRLADRRDRVALLWECCALPDYRRIAPAQHSDLIASMYSDLAERGHVDEAYMAEQVRRADSTAGDIDTLSHRIAQIRTWTFVSNRPGWLADPLHWQEKTREIEDRLSDALHERLTKRFVDRRTSVLMKRLRENTMPEAEVQSNGSVLVEGHTVGDLQGFRFTADTSVQGEDAKAVKAAASKALAQEFESRAEKFAAAGNGDFALASDGTLRWIGAPVATVVATDDPLKPRVILLADEQLTGPSRDKVAARAERFVAFQVESLLKPLVDLRDAEQLTGLARGIAFRLVENFGVINRRDIADDVKGLDQESRAALRRLGVRFGAYHIFVPALLKPAPAGLLTLLWALKNDGKDKPGFGDLVAMLAAGRTSVVVDTTFDPAFYPLAGYRQLGRRAVRIDILERLADLIRPALAWRAGSGTRPAGAFDGQAFMTTPQMMSILGANAEDIEEILKGLGYRGEARPAKDVRDRMAQADARVAEAAEKAAADKAAVDQAAAAEQAAISAAASPSPVAQENNVEVLDEMLAANREAAETAADPVAAGASVLGADNEQPVTDEPVAVEQAGEPDLGAEAIEEAASETAPQASDAEQPVAAEMPAEPLAELVDAGGSVLGETEAEASTEAKTSEEPAAAATASEEETEEEKPVMLWRPARHDRGPRHNQRNNNRRDNNRGGGNRRDGAPAAQAASGENQPADGQPRPDRGSRPDRNRNAGAPGNRNNRPGENRAGENRRDGRPGGGDNKDGNKRFDRRDKDNRGDNERGGGRPPRDDRGAKFSSAPKRDERPARMDPDSPFAKLAALREQLKK